MKQHEKDVLVIMTTITNIVTDMCLARNIDCETVPRILRVIANDYESKLKELAEAECDTCFTPLEEGEQKHYCGDCSEELTAEECKAWAGFCERCGKLQGKL
jgi:hypothetical protein